MTAPEAPRHSGLLDVGGGQLVYWEEWGTPGGVPALYVNVVDEVQVVLDVTLGAEDQEEADRRSGRRLSPVGGGGAVPAVRDPQSVTRGP